jgi:hypothetical protein
MNDDKLTQDVKSIVDGIFKQKEEAAMRKEIEGALDKSANKINELTETLEAKDSEMSKLQERVDELEGTITELETEKEDLEKAKSDFEAEKEELVKQANEAKTELEDMKKDQLAQARFNELKEAGVAATDEKAIKDQTAKIREMEEEEFTSYKEERVELRKSILAELEASSEEGNASEESEEEENSEEAEGEETNSEGSEEEGSSEEENTAEVEENEEDEAANSEEAINSMSAVASLFNMEITPRPEMKEKYREFGKELAKKYIKSE